MEIIRDPLWNNIAVDPLAMRLVDTPAFQRLRYVRQLGLAFLVYPGASHSRFEHALGAYHLARVALAMLAERGDLEGIDDALLSEVRVAMLLHDIGHYPFSHALEEIGALHHEEVARPLITDGPIGAILRRELGKKAPERIVDLIRGTSDSPLQGLISGSLDLDKIEYLRRDAKMCGVPYGEIDEERLLNSLTLVPKSDVRSPTSDVRSPTSEVRRPKSDVRRPKSARTIGIREKGLSAVESLLFAKYQMYRNVYWHHAVRSATSMFKRLVRDAIAAGRVDPRAIATATDDGLIHELLRDDTSGLALRLRERRLAKRALDLAATDLPADTPAWPSDEPELVGRVEDRLARELKLAPGELFLDFPAKPSMLALDVPLVKRDGTVTHLGGDESAAHLGLPRVAAELYRSARRLRVFTLRAVPVDPGRIVDLVMRTRDETLRWLAD